MSEIISGGTCVDICVHLADRPGSLADLGEALGRAGVSLEGGGVFVHDGIGIAHFLVHDAEGARHALAAAGMSVVAVSEVVLLRLNQETPGQLGTLARLMAGSGVAINVQYSDHHNNLVLVVPEEQRALALSAAEQWSRRSF